MTMKLHIRTLAFMLLLLAGGVANKAWAYKVTYYILTLPLDHSKGTANTDAAYDGWRMEAIRVVIDNASNIELPAHFKSPLAKNFTFYPKDLVKKDGTARKIYPEGNGNNKYFLYKAAPYVKVTVSGHAITNEVNSTLEAWTAAESTQKKTATSRKDMEETQVASLDDGDYYFSFQDQCLSEGDEIPSNNYEVYVTYEYNADNTIAKLDGSKKYNVALGDGFLALNRGRNNRPAVIAKKYVTADQLASDEFVKVDLSDGKSGVTTYWKDNSGNNKNKKEDVESQFHFQFVYEGEDPYNITIRSAYNKNTYYIEKDTYDSDFVRKYYKGAVLFGNSVGNKIYLASDVDVKYKTVYNSGEAAADLTLVEYDSKPGYYRGYSPLYNSFALLSSKALDDSKDGYVFMGTRIFNANGTYKNPGSGNYYYLNSTHDNPWYAAMTPATAVGSHSADMYSITRVNFNVPTPFYNPSGTDEEKAAHTLSAYIDISEYKFLTADISDADIPASLKRKYCNINHYYKDAARTQEITKYSDLGEGRDIYLGYEVSMPFQTITPAASYTSATWTAASWYELTDAGSTESNGKKLKYDATNFKNNGPSGEYLKTSEFAFIGDPYELRVISRSQTSGSTPSYVGVASDSPATGTAFTANTTAYSGNVWEMPNDDTDGSFLLRKYKGEGHWKWTTDHLSGDFSYTTASHTYNVPNSNAHTLTLNITNLTYADGNYIKVTAGGTDASQVISTSPVLSTGTEAVSSDGKATVTATIKARGGSDKTFTLTIQEYNSSNVAVGTATVITINQNVSTAYAGNAVEYNTSSSTRIKVMELHKCTYTYNIVDKSGRIAVKATASQTIYSPLSIASIPSIILSPFLIDETLTFYSSYTDNAGRGSLTGVITETSNAPQNIYVKYTTTNLDNKPIKLSEDQEFNVTLNGQFIYCVKEDAVIKIKSKAYPSAEELKSANYLWKLRQRDPYAMLIDNLGAREELDVDNQTETPTIYDDAGGTTTPTRQKGAWVKLASGDLGNAHGLVFSSTRAEAQQFIAKSGSAGGIYEVMLATGADIDASSTYYNIGRPSDNTVKLYDKEHFAHGNGVLDFRLEQTVTYTYHLIDKAKHKLLTLSSKNPDLYLPAEYQSPLVNTYNYYASDNITISVVSSVDEYTPTVPGTKLSSTTDLDATFTYVASDASAYGDASNKKTATDVTDMENQAKALEATGDYYFNINNGESYKKVSVTKAAREKVIYVTYDTDEQFGFGTRSPYTLKFLNGESYKLEDGNDKLTSTKLKAMYPYCNGDGHLNIYGQRMNDEQMNGGSSTRPRWVWFMESENHDPYHVKIHSRSTISFNGASNSTYLQTYAVHFNQDSNSNLQRIVTGGNLAGISQVSATEYMILGEKIPGEPTKYKLLTTNKIAADLNGDGDSSDDGENERRYVTSFEQYWKTYNMLKQCVLGISKSADEFSEDPETFVMPTDKWSDLKTKLSVFQETANDASDYATKKAALSSIGVYYFKIGTGAPYTYNRVTVTKVSPSLECEEVIGGDYATLWANALDINRSTEMNYVDGCVWHSYSAAANALRWNGFDDKEKANSKKVEILEHWFQTFDMGDGTFEIESADIPPVLVLLDRHGWEIMRKPLPIGTDPVRTAALKAYDSPMVETYHFYNNATKAANCHKYTLRTQNGALRDEIKVDGKAFTSTSLGTLPTLKADQFGTYPDVYVTYTVKDEYEKSYTYSYNEDTDVETGTPSKFLIVINSRYARNKVGDTQNYLSKPVSQATNPAGGNVYDMILNPSQVEVGNVIVDKTGGPGDKPDGKIDNNNLWYVQPNLAIDDEMGIPWASEAGGSNEPLTRVETKKKYKDKTGFDPYNLQLKNVDTNEFFTMNLTSTELSNGGWKGTLGSDGITLAAATSSGFVEPEGYDHTTLKITKQTFMAVSDANGNMQLMPRFDHSKRIQVNTGSPNYYTTLANPVNHAEAVVTDNASMGPQTVFLVRPQVFEYHIIDNDGNEALRYKTAGEYSPSIPDKLNSPLATDFEYYKNLTLTDGVYTEISTKADISSKKISGLFAEAGLDADENDVYVRYSYDESADIDADNILQGKWFTMKLAGKDVQSSGTFDPADGTGISLYAGVSSRSLMATDGDDVDTKAKKLAATGDYYFKQNDEDNYWLVNVTTAYDGSTDATYTKTSGSYATEWANSKPLTPNEVDATRKWQWKFIAANKASESPDPYAVHIYNRKANYSASFVADPNPMGVGIKVNGKDRFAILSHPTDGYALAVAGLGSYTNSFLNGASMTAPSTTAATTVEECYQKTVTTDEDYDDLKDELAAGADAVYYIKINGTEVSDIPQYKRVTISSGVAEENDATPEQWENAYISPGAKLILNDDVDHNYVYHVITNDASGNKLAISATQTKAEAEVQHSVPYLPDDIQTPLLNTDDYIYYGSATIDQNETPSDPSDDTYTMVDATKLITLYGLYDDKVYVRYKAYDPDNTGYLVPNKKAIVDSKAVRASGSNDVAIDINGGLPYNIYWADDNMMKRGDADAISYDASHELSGSAEHIWKLEGNDPYAIKIKHDNSGKYVIGTGTLSSSATKTFMLLNKEGYDYGILQETGGNNRLTGYGQNLTSGDPTKFILFGLSTHRLIYHLVINTTNATTTIPYRSGTESSPGDLDTKDIPGTTQRDLISMSYGVPGDKYQLGSTIMGRTYSVDAGEVSLGDELVVPNEFDRPNCVFFFYIDNIQEHGASATNQKEVANEAALKTDADALTAVGNYYYKITGGKIYRKVHVSSVSPSVVYEVSGSTKAAYDAAATSTAFQSAVASVDAMKTDAASITTLGDHYYNVNSGEAYYRFTKYPIAVNGEADTTFVVCTKDDYDHAVASKESAVADEAAMETAAASLASVGDYYYEIGTMVLYKKVHVTTANDGENDAIYTVVDCAEDDWNNVWKDDDDMNDKYKGLEVTKLMSDAGLIGGMVNVNVSYGFQTGLETNAGEGFVTSVGQNLWYTFEAQDGSTPFLAHYTNAWGLQAMEGRETRYTNDYLWTPLGDVYGFRMYNRYMIKNSGGVSNVMTMASISEGQNLLLHLPDATYTHGNEVFELLPSNNLGYFRIHPVINHTGTRYYIRKNPSDNYAKLSTTSSEWTFNLTTELLNPYIERVGYVGGLTETAYTANKTVLDKVKGGTASYADMLEVQGIVYNDANIVKYAPGYYRLHSQPGVSGISPVRYASGYLHDIEKGSGKASAIPLHFYSKKGTSTTFETLENGFTYSHATRGPIPVPATEYDPSSIFYFDGIAVDAPDNPTSKMQTQGLYVAEDTENGIGYDRKNRAVMSASSGDAINLTLMDIGGAVLLIHDGEVPANRRYLNFDQTNFFQKTATDASDYTTQKAALPSVGVYYFKYGSTYKKVTVTTTSPFVSTEEESNATDWERAADIYDLKYYHESPTDDAKWCMEPANNQGLLVETHSGGDGYYYTTFYAPYDLQLPADVAADAVKETPAKHYYAYICTDWNTQMLRPKKTGNSGKNIPANTPVIIRTDDNSGNVKLSFPASSLSAESGNIFTGSYLEQLLETPITASDKVYTMGLPITGYGLVTDEGATNGNITHYIDRSQDYTGVGFYINATQNKELSEETGQWLPNNRYVLHNKIYYRGGGGSSREDRDITRGVQFVPVVFDDGIEEEDEEGDPTAASARSNEVRIYDLQGRRRTKLQKGLNIVNGKKVVVK